MVRRERAVPVLVLLLVIGCGESSSKDDLDVSSGMYCQSHDDCSIFTKCKCHGSACFCGTGSGAAICEHDSDCEPGRHCDMSLAPYPGKGACAGGGQGDWCQWESCEDGLVCVAETNQAAEGTCGPIGKGAECWGSWSCPAGLSCQTAFPGGTHACVTATAKEGDLCNPTEFSMCEDGLGCNLMSDPAVCEESGSMGVQCLTDEDCEEGLICAPSWSVCLLGKDYSPCKKDWDCQGYPVTHDCILALGVCSSHGVGSACQDDCPLPLQCVTGPAPHEWPICQDGGGGAYCDVDEQCDQPFLCLDAEDGKRCGGSLAEGGDCSSFVPGIVECEDGLVCNHGHNPPECLPLANSGEKCGDATDCVAGCLCIPTGVGGKCSDGSKDADCKDDSHCQPQFWCAPGLSICVTGEEGTDCAKSDDCNDGLYCPPAVHKCSPGGDASPCTEDGHCPEGFWCVDGQVCHDGDEGDMCTTAQECLEPLVCVSLDGKCHDGNAGDPCVSDEDCLLELVCVESIGKCSAGNIGKSCDSVQDCQEGLWCVTSVGECHAGGNGEPCDSDEECQLDQWCVASVGKCHNGISGEPCGVEEDCLPGFWCVAGAGQCTDGTPDSPCDSSEECLEGALCEGEPSVCNGGYDLWPCTGNGNCQSGWHCLELDQPLCYNGSLADPCIGHEDCATDLLCATQLPNPICIPAGVEGDTCFVPKECKTGFYCFTSVNICFDGTTGDPCNENTQCVEESCNAGQCQ